MALAIASTACSSKAPSKAATADTAAVSDAAPAANKAAAMPAIEWRDDGTLAVGGAWRIDPETWVWTATADGREVAATKTPFPETPPAASAGAIREASGKWSAWAEATRICFIDMPAPGYVCAELPQTP